MAKTQVKVIGLKEFQQAIKRNPQRTVDEVKNFLTRGLAVYKKGIVNNPWRIGGKAGGSPVSNDPRYPRAYQRQRSGNLRDTHITKVETWRGSIGPNLQAAPYGIFVHEGTGKMEKRPWLDYVKKNKQSQIKKLYRGMLENIVKDLAK